MENNKSSGNDELFEVFYECFQDEVKQSFLASIHKAFLSKELSSSQKQAGKKNRLGKKEKDKRFIKNWRQISLLSTNMKTINKVLSTRKKMYYLF